MTIRHLLVGCSGAPGTGGGIFSYTADLCLALRARGVLRVSMVSPAPPQGSWADHGVTDWIRAGQDEDPTHSAAAILAFVRDQGVDAILNNDHPYLQAIAPLSPVPFVSVVHFPRHAIFALAGWNHAAVDHTVAISATMAAKLQRRFGIPPDRCPLVHTGIPTDLLRVDRAPRADGGQPTAIFLGGWVKAKGADLVRDLALASSSCWKSWRLEWFGPVPPGPRRRLNALPHVTLRGAVARQTVVQALAGADLLLFPSREEGCPMALLEGMALGVVPVAARGSGAMAEIVRPGRDGYLWDLGRWVPESLQLLAALAGTGVDPKLSRAARERVHDWFLIDRCVERLLGLLAAPQLVRPLGVRRVPVLDWHRRTSNSGKGRPIDRLRYRLGWLKVVGAIEVPAEPTPPRHGGGNALPPAARPARITPGAHWSLLPWAALGTVLAFSAPAPASEDSFEVLWSLEFAGMVDLARCGLDPRAVAVVYASQFWPGDMARDTVNKVVVEQSIVPRVERAQPRFVVLDVEHWPASEIGKYVYLLKTFGTSLRGRWSGRIGMFEILPPATYGIETSATSAHLRAWQNRAVKAEAILPHVNALFPSFYFTTSDFSVWRRAADIAIDAAKRYDLPVYGFVWPLYLSDDPSLAGRFVSGELWRRQLDYLLGRDLAGVVVWGSQTDDQGQTVVWDPSAGWWTETKAFLADLRREPAIMDCDL